MLLRRIAQHLKSENWVAVVLDLLVVVVGIVIAFQVERWYEGRRDLEVEQSYLRRLRADLETEMEQFEEIVTRTGTRLEQCRILEAAFADPAKAAEQPMEFVIAMERVTWRSFPVITAYTYGELVSSGRMTLLRSQDLRLRLAEYYTLLEETRRLGLEEDDQDKFRDLTVGLLSAEQLSAVEAHKREDLQVSAEEATRIATEFSGRLEARGWLARLAKYQVLMRIRAEGFVKREKGLIASIDALLGAGV